MQVARPQVWPADVGLFLEPLRLSIPFRKILNRFVAARFEPRACQAALAEILAQHELPAEYFDLAAFDSGGLVATEALLLSAFAPPATWRLQLLRDGRRLASWGLPPEQLGAVAQLVRGLATTPDLAALSAGYAETLGADIAAVLALLPPSVAPSDWPEPSAPGIYRREHASVLIRSRQATLLFDPLRLAVGRFPPTLGKAPRSTQRPSAIAITHLHEDHFHLPSLLAAAERDTLAIVPPVPAASLLTNQVPRHTLELCGQRVVDPAWGSQVEVGDMTIDVLPFFGEQPTRTAPGPALPLRNWGSCYRVNTPDFSALLIVDSGADPLGNMAEVAERSRQAHGPVDVVLSCAQEFPSPFFTGVASECLTLPFWRQRELFADLLAGRLPSTTAGPRGIVEICQAAGARYFLTYANGFSALGQDSGIDWGAGPPESLVIADIAARLSARGVATRAITWNAGDAAQFDRGELALRAYAELCPSH